VAQNDRAIDILRALGITIVGSIIVDPDYGREEFKRVLEFVRRKKVDSPTFCIMTPFPGTDLYQRTRGNIVGNDWVLYDMQHTVFPTKLELDEFYSEFASLWLYHLEPVPLEHHMKRLAGLPPEDLNEMVINNQAYLESIKTLSIDHKRDDERAYVERFSNVEVGWEQTV
jgi:hypothetical protein